MKTTKRNLTSALVLSAAMAAMLAGGAAFSAPPPAKGPPGGGETAQGNNLSFPALAVDGYAINPITQSQWTVPYTGPYTGLSEAEIAALTASGPWYAQKTEGNTWQADYLTGQTVDVTYVDWGDVIESVNPKVGRPFRVEVQLYKLLHPWDEFDGTNGMTGYVMAMLANPSSPDEVQGNNEATYNGNLATVVSNLWKLRIQKCGDAIPETTDLQWNVDRWVSPTITCTDEPIVFAVELNVGGKLIFGASTGGWKVKTPGWYRITFYGPLLPSTKLSLVGAEVANYDDFKAPPPVEPVLAAEEGETGAATPVVDDLNNLSYVDVLAVASGGGGGKKGGR